MVVGSFPPVRTAATNATLSAVRRELAAGRAVITASPRPSAASLVLRLYGPRGSWRLEEVRRRTKAERLVLSLEPGWPLPPGIGLILRRFARVTLLASDESAQGIRTMQRLRAVKGAEVCVDAVAPETAVPGSERTSTATALGPRGPEWQSFPTRTEVVLQHIRGAIRDPRRAVASLGSRLGVVRRMTQRRRSTPQSRDRSSVTPRK